MRPFRVNTINSALLVAVVMVFSLIVPPFIQACGCDCASGMIQALPADDARSAIPDGCCAGQCALPPPDDSAAGRDHRQDDADASCCCSAEKALPGERPVLLARPDPRPSTPESLSAEALLPAGIGPIGSRKLSSIIVTDRKLSRVSIHISSTVLLI